ncbi:helix-turn-helix transcriptional regulator [Mediterraneibacter sp. NSJ-55]|uniref:Helix-turn-helix transcriptional regulator n=1 Tax=Mediterraneibacter hominis TaxID=2763054 RepID=A0A923RTL2_9FIRM|nr:helix-turn-helix transcriptional regulator [Mediterraneibacter hominis]MBC5690392.1 helix-turn-helix transcriptional regulator [Mediterraneibacter hominis]
MYEEDFCSRLLALRTEKGVSARDMSLSLGQNAGYINHIERRQALPSLNVFFNICEYLDITPEQFFDTGQNSTALIKKIVENLNCLSQNQIECLSSIISDLAANKGSG